MTAAQGRRARLKATLAHVNELLEVEHRPHTASRRPLIQLIALRSALLEELAIQLTFD
jgi:hypothetical protein